MAIVKRNGKSRAKYQVRVKGTDGRWISETFDRRTDAEAREAQLVLEKRQGHFVTSINNNLTVAEYFAAWDKETLNTTCSLGWRTSQRMIFRQYVEPVIGSHKLRTITPALISRILGRVTEMGRADGTKRQVYVFMKKLFGDAVELFQIADRNPVLRTLRPKVPVKEADYLVLQDIIKLLNVVRGQTYEVGVWLGLFAGRRFGEIQSLKWQHVDLENGFIQIRSTYLRKEKRFQDYPKGKKWHTIKMPPELLDVLRRAKEKSTSEFVAPNLDGKMLSYHTYHKALKRYCREAGVQELASHGLRHSTSELYMHYGASRDDLRMLFAHSTSAVTDRYIHDKGQRLAGVADVIRLFPEQDDSVSPKFPQPENLQESLKSSIM